MRRQLSCRSPQIIPGTKKLTCPSWNVTSGQVGQFHRRPGFSPPSYISQDHYQFCGSPNVSWLTHTYLCNFPAKLPPRRAHARAELDSSPGGIGTTRQNDPPKIDPRGSKFSTPQITFGWKKMILPWNKWSPPAPPARSYTCIWSIHTQYFGFEYHKTNLNRNNYYNNNLFTIWIRV